uniref:Uncharacterized protein n=1 Tax=Ditylenchus dipsaci TaxID=166011 RepID=A0A915EE57_9BILA
MSVDVKANWNMRSFGRPLRGKTWTKSADTERSIAQLSGSQLQKNGPNLASQQTTDIDTEAKVCIALKERDEMWRKHEKAQIEYIQTRSAHILTGLHAELEKLQNINRDLERQLFVSVEPCKIELDRVRGQLSAERKSTATCRKQLGVMSRRNACLAQTLEKTAQLYKHQIAQYESKIAETNEQIKKLTAQVVSFRSKHSWAENANRNRTRSQQSSCGSLAIDKPETRPKYRSASSSIVSSCRKSLLPVRKHSQSPVRQYV